MTERKLDELVPVWVETISKPLEHGTLYISEKYGTAIHLCACGCGNETVMPFQPFWPEGWSYGNNDGFVTFAPSVGNMGFCPNKAHYFIERNQVRWC